MAACWPAAGRLPHPEAVGSLIERRLRQLSPRALSLARVAAVAGVDFGVELVERATAVPAVELADAWAELEQAQVLRDSGFAHDLVCDAVLRTLPAPVARHLHGVVASWLVQRSAEPGRVALHWLAAAMPQHALAPLLQAARHASAAVRPAEALAFYEQVRQIFEADGQPAREGEVLFKMSECLRLLDDARQTQRELDRLHAIASDDGERARAWLVASRLANEMRHMAHAQACARKALDCAQAFGEAELIGRGHLQLALVLGESIQGAEAQLHLQAARGTRLGFDGKRCRAQRISPLQRHGGDATRRLSGLHPRARAIAGRPRGRGRPARRADPVGQPGRGTSRHGRTARSAGQR